MMRPHLASFVLTSMCCGALGLLLPWVPSGGTGVSATLINLTIEADQGVAQVNSTIRLTCSLDTEGQPQWYSAHDIVWIHNETVLAGVRNHTLNASVSQLVLEGVQIEDSGVYKCCLAEACSDVANSVSVHILIDFPPEPATNLVCSSSNFENVNCTWTRGRQRSSLLTTDTLKRRKNRSSGNNAEWGPCSSSQATCSATACYCYCSKSQMSFEYRVESSSPLGSVYSEPVDFDTDHDTIPNPPSDVTVMNKSVSSLIVKWERPVVKSYYLVKYCIKYRWEGEDTWTQIGNKKGEIDGDKTRYVLGNLTHPYGLYYIRVGSRGSHKEKCNFSGKVSGRTTEAAPTDMPGNFKCLSEDQDLQTYSGTRNVSLSWEPLPNEYKENGEILDYVIIVKNQNMPKPVADLRVGPNETSYRISGLAQNESYTINIQARNSMGKSEPGTCHVPSITPAGVHYTLVLIIVLCVFLALLMVMFLLLARGKYKKAMRRLPEVKLPSGLMNNNFAHPQRRTVIREREEFDELLPNGLSIILTPEPTHMNNGLGTAATCNGGIANTFDIGDEKLQLGARGESRSMNSTRGCNMDVPNALSPESLNLLGQRDRHPSSGTFSVSSSLHSPISVGSGGSYLLLQNVDKISYSKMTKDGLSPIDKDGLDCKSITDQRSSVDSPPGDQRDLPRQISHFVWDEGITDRKSSVTSVESNACSLAESSQPVSVFSDPATPSFAGPPNSPYCQLSIQSQADMGTPTKSCERAQGCAETLHGARLISVTEEQDSTMHGSNWEARSDGLEMEDVFAEEGYSDEDSVDGVDVYTLSALAPSGPEPHMLPLLNGLPRLCENDAEMQSKERPKGFPSASTNRTDSVDRRGATESAGGNVLSLLLPVCSANEPNDNLSSESHTRSLVYFGGVEASGADVNSESQDNLGNTGDISTEEAALLPLKSRSGNPSDSSISGYISDEQLNRTSEEVFQDGVSESNDILLYSADGCYDSLCYIDDEDTDSDVGGNEEDQDTRSNMLNFSPYSAQPPTESNNAVSKSPRFPAEVGDIDCIDQFLSEGRCSLNYVAVETDGDEEMAGGGEGTSDGSLSGISSHIIQSPTNSVLMQGSGAVLMTEETLCDTCDSLNYVTVSMDNDDVDEEDDHYVDREGPRVMCN